MTNQQTRTDTGLCQSETSGKTQVCLKLFTKKYEYLNCSFWCCVYDEALWIKFLYNNKFKYVKSSW